MTDTFRGFTRGALTFLRQLKRNNKREWFLAEGFMICPTIFWGRQSRLTFAFVQRARIFTAHR